MWTGAYLLVVALTAAGMLLPHVRPLQSWHALTVDELVAVARVEVLAGYATAVVWLTGASLAAIVAVVGWLKSARFLEDCQLRAASEPPGESGIAANRPACSAANPCIACPAVGSSTVRILCHAMLSFGEQK
jgi:hypothetical protein